MKTGFIGYGKVGASLMNYFYKNGIEISGVYSPNSKAEFFNNFSSLEETANSSDLIFLTITDSKIEEVWNRLKEIDIKNKIICHCSGSLSSDVFGQFNDCFGCSIHPMLAFDSKWVSSEKISKAFFTIEGDEKALEEIKKILYKCGNDYKIIDKGFKKKYHCAAAVASNIVVSVFDMAEKMLLECGFSEKEARLILNPIFLQNVENICEKGCVKALTGPIERNDIKTIIGHLSCLENDEEKIYKLLSKRLINISQEKNPHRDYEKLKKLLEENEDGNS